jgi:hypothetical protein
MLFADPQLTVLIDTVKAFFTANVFLVFAVFLAVCCFFWVFEKSMFMIGLRRHMRSFR